MSVFFPFFRRLLRIRVVVLWLRPIHGQLISPSCHRSIFLALPLCLLTSDAHSQRQSPLTQSDGRSVVGGRRSLDRRGWTKTLTQTACLLIHLRPLLCCYVVMLCCYVMLLCYVVMLCCYVMLLRYVVVLESRHTSYSMRKGSKKMWQFETGGEEVKSILCPTFRKVIIIQFRLHQGW